MARAVRNGRTLVAGLAFLTVGIIGLALLSAGRLVPSVTAADPVARGEWIYRTGADVDGRPILYSGGMMMMRMACADCHGLEGHGLRTPMFLSPDISYANLSDPAGMREPHGDRGPTYTDDLLQRAVISGIDADGERVAWPMPRWQLSDDSWRDLLAYLKTLR